MKTVAMATTLLALSTTGLASQERTQGRDAAFVHEAATLGVRGPALLKALSDRKELAAACSITTAHLASAEQAGGDDLRSAVASKNKACCSAMASGLGTMISGNLIGHSKTAGSARPGTLQGLIVTNQVLKHMRQGLLEPVIRDIEKIADDAQKRVAEICLPTVAFADVVARQDR